jgi:hypothetical protein
VDRRGNLATFVLSAAEIWGFHQIVVDCDQTRKLTKSQSNTCGILLQSNAAKNDCSPQNPNHILCSKVRIFDSNEHAAAKFKTSLTYVVLMDHQDVRRVCSVFVTALVPKEKLGHEDTKFILHAKNIVIMTSSKNETAKSHVKILAE